MRTNEEKLTVTGGLDPERKAWIAPQIVDAPVAGTSAKSPDQLESGASIKLGS